MRRHPAPVRGALTALLAAIALLVLAAPAVLADDPARDPRCAAWEAGTPPPGIDLDAVCPPLNATEVPVDLDREPLMPYIVALVVMGGVFTAFGFIAMRVMAKPATTKRAKPTDFWPCPACGTPNRPDRGSCFSCQASKDPSATVEPHPG